MSYPITPAWDKFSRWINAHGIEAVADHFKVTTATVRNWRRGHCLPRREQLVEIIRTSQLTYADIIERKH